MKGMSISCNHTGKIHIRHRKKMEAVMKKMESKHEEMQSFDLQANTPHFQENARKSVKFRRS